MNGVVAWAAQEGEIKRKVVMGVGHLHYSNYGDSFINTVS